VASSGFEDYDLVVDPSYQWLGDVVMSLHRPENRDDKRIRQSWHKKLVPLILYGRELVKRHPQALHLRHVWSLALVHCCRDKCSLSLDIRRELATQVLTVGYRLGRWSEPESSAVQFLNVAIAQHWLKFVDGATLRFTTEGYQLIYPFTRYEFNQLYNIRSLDSLIDHEECEATDEGSAS